MTTTATTTATTTGMPLDELAHRVDAMFRRSEDMRVSAGYLLLEARKRVEAGEAGAGVTWKAWLAANVRRSHRDVNRLLTLVRADDPEAAAAREREATRRRVACLRRGGTYVRPTPPRTTGIEAAVARVEAIPVGGEAGPGPGPVTVEALAAAYGALHEAERAAFLERLGAGAAAGGPRRVDDGVALTLVAVAAHARNHTASGPDAARWALIKWACEAALDRVRAASRAL